MQKTKPSCTDPGKIKRTINGTIITETCRCFLLIAYIAFIVVALGTNISFQKYEYDLWTIIFHLLFIGGLIYALVDFIKQLVIIKELMRDGITVRAEIIKKWIEVDSEAGDIMYIGYQFKYLDNTWVGKYRDGNTKRYERLQIGQIITIRFLPRDPEISRLE